MVSDTGLAASLLVDSETWCLPAAARPDGACAVFRSGDASIEIASDTLASRFVDSAATAGNHWRRVTDRPSCTLEATHFADAISGITLPSSVDSFILLVLLGNGIGLRAVTWNLRSATTDPVDDAGTARRRAEHCGLEHQYCQANLTGKPPDRTFAPLLVNGKGRITRVYRYADRFRPWSALLRAGIRRIVLEDLVSGHRVVPEPRHAPVRVGLTLCHECLYWGCPRMGSGVCYSSTSRDHACAAPGPLSGVVQGRPEYPDDSSPRRRRQFLPQLDAKDPSTASVG